MRRKLGKIQEQKRPKVKKNMAGWGLPPGCGQISAPDIEFMVKAATGASMSEDNGRPWTYQFLCLNLTFLT